VQAVCRGGSTEIVPEKINGLMDRAVSGDRAALASLLEEHGPEVRRRIVPQIPQRWQAVLTVDDVMQETYIDAFLDIGRFEPRGEGSFTAWLTTLAKRNLLDALRMLEAEKRGKHHRPVTAPSAETSLVAIVEQLVGTTSTPSQHAARNEAGMCLRNAIAKLPLNYRRVVELYDLQGRPVDDVAAALERSAGAVFMLRARALRQIGALMGTASLFLSGRS
jgi:RNA polymerase sigma-70 factor (ECF subfamily)